MGDRCVLCLPVGPTAALLASSIPSFENDIGSKSDADLVRMINMDSTTQAKEHLFATGRQHTALAET
jgi:hypothetical protein